MPKAKGVTAKRQEFVELATNEMEAALNKMMDLYEKLNEIRFNMEEKFPQTEKYQRLEEVLSNLEEIEGFLFSALLALQGFEVGYS